MKKLLAILLTLSLLLCAWPALAESALEAAAQSVQAAVTLDEQLAALDALATDGAGELADGVSMKTRSSKACALTAMQGVVVVVPAIICAP